MPKIAASTANVRDVTRYLLAWREGDPGALDRLLPIVYAELRRIAHARMRAESPDHHTLQTTALINEAYLRLVAGTDVPWRNRTHFYAVCARMMRRILVDRARARAAQKRQGREVPGRHRDEVSLSTESILALDDALERLAKADARKAEVVVMRYFGGLSVEETSATLGISVETVMRDWKVARLWLRRILES